MIVCVYLHTSVHPLPGLLAELFPCLVFSANNALLHTVLWYKVHLQYVTPAQFSANKCVCVCV